MMETSLCLVGKVAVDRPRRSPSTFVKSWQDNTEVKSELHRSWWQQADWQYRAAGYEGDQGPWLGDARLRNDFLYDPATGVTSVDDPNPREESPERHLIDEIKSLKRNAGLYEERIAALEEKLRS